MGWPVCVRRCGLPFVSPHALDSSVPECSACRGTWAAFDGARSFGIYSGKASAGRAALEVLRDERLGLRLGELLAVTWESLPKLGESPLISSGSPAFGAPP